MADLCVSLYVRSFASCAQFHQYQVVGRALPTPGDEQPKIYRMKLWATNEVRAKSKFWSVPSRTSVAESSPSSRARTEAVSVC
jgi:hypothetical protein